MKHTYSFLAGALLVSSCVVATRTLPGYMFLCGSLLTLLAVVLLSRAVGAGRIARFLLRYSDKAGWRSMVSRQAHNLEIAGSNPAPATKLQRAHAPRHRNVNESREKRQHQNLSESLEVADLDSKMQRCYARGMNAAEALEELRVA